MKERTTKEDLIRWLEECFARGEPGKNKAALARALGKDRSAITHIMAGTRNISAEELVLMEKFFGEPRSTNHQVVEKVITGGVPIMGRVGEFVWTKAGSARPAERFIGSVTSEYPLDEQAAYEVVDATPDGEYRAGDVIYTVPFSSYRVKPTVGDVVTVQETQGEFTRMSLRRAVSTGAGIVLGELTKPGDPVKPGASEEVIVGLMIGFYRPMRKF